MGDDEIELYALGRVRDPDPELVAHFLACDACSERIEKARIFAAEIKRALTEPEGSAPAGATQKRRKHTAGL
jgi:hypothetical protein